eukprot:15443145-Alexandrium_andersonii.AAC.1
MLLRGTTLRHRRWSADGSREQRRIFESFVVRESQRRYAAKAKRTARAIRRGDRKRQTFADKLSAAQAGFNVAHTAVEDLYTSGRL